MRSSKTHSYDVIRSAAVDIIAGREGTSLDPNNFPNLAICVAETLMKRDGERPSGSHESLGDADAELLRDVFWDLFRQGVITIGLDRHNADFPWFRLSYLGRQMIQGQGPYFFHDVTSYEKTIRENVAAIDDTTLLYAKEAMQAYLSGCILSATVMIGVAAEGAFEELLDTIAAKPTHATAYAPVLKERLVLRRLLRFRETIAKHANDLPASLKEGLETNLLGIAELIRNFRNDSGHPSGKVVSREQCYILLHLFVPYCKKVYELSDYFGA